MCRRLSLALRAIVSFAAMMIILIAQPRQAVAADALSYFKNYFVTGDVTFASVGLRSTGVDGWSTGVLNMTGVPCTTAPGVSPAGVVPCDTRGAIPSDVVAAFLYWETEETTSSAAS